MGNKEDGLALLLEPAHDLHQLVDLLRGQHSGGLVEDEDLIVAVEHLQNLHALLHTHRNITDERIGVNTQAVLLAQGHDLLAGLSLLQKAQLVGLHAQNDVVQHAEALHQLEVLVDHTDAQCVRIVGVADGDLLAVLEDLTLLRLIQAEQHAHQRALACTVLAQQGMDLALSQLQGNVVVGLDARELLGDMEHLDHKILCQSAHSPFVSKRHLYYSNAHYTVFLLFCTLLFENLVFCYITSITFVHFDGHSFLVLKKHTKKAGRPLQSAPPGKALITGCS